MVKNQVVICLTTYDDFIVYSKRFTYNLSYGYLLLNVRMEESKTKNLIFEL